jgi:hypothetical protein
VSPGTGRGGEFESTDCGLTRQDLTRVLSFAGATVLHREPDPAKTTFEGVKRPYHASADCPMAGTTHLIVYPPVSSYWNSLEFWGWLKAS